MWSYVLFLVSLKIYHLVWSVLQYPPGVQSTKNSNMYCMWSYVLFLVPFRISPRLQASMGVACSSSSCSSFSSYPLVHVLHTSFVLWYLFYSADTTLERSCTTSKGQYSWGHELAGPILAPTGTIIFKYVCVVIKYYFYVWKYIICDSLCIVVKLLVWSILSDCEINSLEMSMPTLMYSKSTE